MPDDPRSDASRPPDALREEREATAAFRASLSKLSTALLRWVGPLLVLCAVGWWGYGLTLEAALEGESAGLGLIMMGAVAIGSGALLWMKLSRFYDEVPELGEASRALEVSRRAQDRVKRLAVEQREAGGGLSLSSSAAAGGGLAMTAEAGGVSEREEVELDFGDEAPRGEADELDVVDESEAEAQTEKRLVAP